MTICFARDGTVNTIQGRKIEISHRWIHGRLAMLNYETVRLINTLPESGQTKDGSEYKRIKTGRNYST
jgi:hypothetical protein